MQIDIKYIKFLFETLDSIRWKIIVVKQKHNIVKSRYRRTFYKQYIHRLNIDYKLTYEELASYADEIWTIDNVIKSNFI